MSKTDQKSKKRRRSTSSNHLASLEEKMSHLIDILSHKEVRTPSRPSRSVSRSSSLAHQEGQGSRIETGSVYSTKPDSDDNILASLARQVGPTDPQGVYDNAGSVFAKYRRQDDTTLFAALSECSKHRIFFTEVSCPLKESDTLLGSSKQNRLENDPTLEEDISLTKQLFGPDLEGEETQPWNERVFQKWRELTRNGLPADQREVSLKKYSPPHRNCSFSQGPYIESKM